MLGGVGRAVVVVLQVDFRRWRNFCSKFTACAFISFVQGSSSALSLRLEFGTCMPPSLLCMEGRGLSVACKDGRCSLFETWVGYFWIGCRDDRCLGLLT